ncbi:ADP-ribosylglycohydrolase [Trichodelitschia bisporula]|uniref:ADP-ribosylglycohydrolase n=1 Tax=Trichodelitschia bisporula TaxID=703511 RepID=A0A6G1HIM4_9PEZI|nr:ADP-ribosylglycohydrolase [Trichodelitschia bisporula]
MAAHLSSRMGGAMLGMALGDAIGVYTEWKTAAECRGAYNGEFYLHPKPTRYVPTKSHSRPVVPPGRWTDNTENGICILLAFLARGLDEKAFAKWLHYWGKQGLAILATPLADIGVMTSAIVRPGEYYEQPTERAFAYWLRTGKNAAANGSLVRSPALAALTLDMELNDVFMWQARYSAVTHADPRCIVACAIAGGLMKGLANASIRTAEDIELLVRQVKAWWPNWVRCGGNAAAPKRENAIHLGVDWVEIETVARATEFRQLLLDQSASMRYVLKTLGAGIVAAKKALADLGQFSGGMRERMRGMVFEKYISEIVMCGGEADTNAAFAGGVLGALVGEERLPKHWTKGLVNGEWLWTKTKCAGHVLGCVEGRHGNGGDRDRDLNLELAVL